MSWGQIKFGDFITLQRGHDLTKEQFIPGEYPVVSSTTIMGYHNEYKVEAPGVVIGRSGTLGEVQYIDTNFWPHNTSLYVKDFKGNNPRFVYYFLKYFGTESSGGGSAVPTLNRNNLNVLDVNIPDVYLQKKISDVLSVYDDLIENNQKQIKLLEEAAQRLYKEWFVDLRFPGYENTPIIDGVPQGWSVSSVGGIGCNIESGSRPKGGIDSSLSNGIPSIGAENVIGLGKYNFSSDKFVSSEFYASMKRGKLKDRDILVYKDGAYIGRTSLFQDGFPHQAASVNEHVFLLHAENEILQYYLFFTLYQHEYYLKMQKLNKNAAQPGINAKAMLSLGILLPPLELIQTFDEFIAHVMKNIFAKAKENRELIDARDRLLPKLMSGELEV